MFEEETQETYKNNVHDDREVMKGARFFSNADVLLEYVNMRWRERWVIVNLNIGSETTLQSMLRRPYFLLVSVDAPVSVRWQRYKTRYAPVAQYYQLLLIQLQDMKVQERQCHRSNSLLWTMMSITTIL